MARKKKAAGGGAPEWMVTYGDMMGLLLCFFVILVSMSEMKQDERFQKVMESLRRAFGYEGGIGMMTSEMSPDNSMSKQMTELVMRQWQTKLGKSAEEGIEGENPSVRTVREGLQYTVGGQISFEPGKAVLLQGAKKQLDIFADFSRGMNNKIRIRGHAARKPAEFYRPYANLYDLSYARAVAVKDYLVEKGIREQRITVEACGDNEPLAAEAYDENARNINRRVDIIATETLVQDYEGAIATDSGDLVNG
ncbi:MAG: OmpA family protein [Sedimentisphaerales bacterium]|nr:OmpA family protein [Sedimentisphaerales bacterium]